jgi:hypothetical protein
MTTFKTVLTAMLFILVAVAADAQAQKAASLNDNTTTRKLFMDVHHLEPGKVTYADVVAAHSKDLAVQEKFGVSFMKFWLDAAKGDVYCLSTAPSSDAINRTHSAAHGLLPNEIYSVIEGQEAAIKGNKNLYLDIHHLGPGNVTAAAVAEAHKKDLAVQNKYGVNFINYWVNEKEGIVLCLSEAADYSNVISTHKEAHGLIPAEVLTVMQGQ